MGRKKSKKTKAGKIFKHELSTTKNKGLAALSSLNGQKAVKFFKQAVKNAATTQEKNSAESCLLRAYRLRFDQLMDKNLIVEAESMKKIALANMPDPGFMDEEAMLSLFYLCESDDNFNLAVESYQKFYNYCGKSHRLEKHLADIAVVKNLWEPLTILDQSILLVRDRAIIQPASEMMNSGEWDQAMELMKSLPRSSPFAHIRMFCRAVTAFYSDKNQDVEKAVSMIPENSIFKKFGKALYEQSGDKEHLRIKNCFWQGPINAFDKIDALSQLVRKEEYGKKMQTAIQDLSMSLMPDNEKIVSGFLLESIYTSKISFDFDKREQFFKMAESIDMDLAEILRCKSDMFNLGSLGAVVDYFDVIDKEFSESNCFNKESLPVVRAMVIQFFIDHSISYNFELNLYDYSPGVLEKLEIYSLDNDETALLELIAFGVSLDPENRDLYEQAALLPGKSTTSKKVKEEIFLNMCRIFPDDPFSYLELAEMFQDKNAYRRAENILKKAMELAPHDRKVLDRHTISLIISADNNLGRKNFKLMWNDFEKARGFNQDKFDLLLTEKELFYKICEAPDQFEKIFKLQSRQFSVFTKLQVLSLMTLDLSRRNTALQNRISQKIENEFINALSHLALLPSSQILLLLLPLSHELRHIFRSSSMVKLFCDISDKVLSCLAPEDLLSLIDQHLFPGVYDFYIDELDIRTDTQSDESIYLLMEFYYVVICALQDDMWGDYDFREIIEEADPDTEKKMKDASLKFSKHTSGAVKIALETFDFNILEAHFDPFSENFDDPDSFYDDLEFDPSASPFPPELPDISPMLEALISNIEMLIDQEGLRGASEAKLKKLRAQLLGDNEMNMMLTMVFATGLTGEFRKKMSKEARILLLDNRGDNLC